MTDEKQHVDLSTIEPVFRGADPEEAESSERPDDVDHVSTITPTPVGTAPAVGVLAENDQPPPADPDDLDRLRRG